MKILIRILGLSLILSALYSCSSPPVSYVPKGPIYCSPYVYFIYAGKDVETSNTRKWERELPSLNDITTAELGNSIITRIPVKTIDYFVFDDNDTFQRDIYDSSSMAGRIVESTLSPEEILEVKGDSFCSNRRKKTSLQMIYAEILEKPFDFTKDESYTADYEELKYVKNKREMKERWRQQLKFSTIANYDDAISQRDTNMEANTLPESVFSAQNESDRLSL